MRQHNLFDTNDADSLPTLDPEPDPLPVARTLDAASADGGDVRDEHPPGRHARAAEHEEHEEAEARQHHHVGEEAI